MGQYYKPIALNKKQYVHAHEFDTGLKLMEHSYLNNPLTMKIENLLEEGGDWHKSSIVWAGDYADGEEKESKIEGNLYNGINKRVERPRYLVNHTQKLYINLKELDDLDERFVIHPLPLLTCEGNGRGNGDFIGDDERIGSWARNRISMEIVAPDGYTKVNGLFKEKRE